MKILMQCGQKLIIKPLNTYYATLRFEISSTESMRQAECLSDKDESPSTIHRGLTILLKS